MGGLRVSCRGVEVLVRELERSGVRVRRVERRVRVPPSLDSWPRGEVDAWPLCALQGVGVRQEYWVEPSSVEEAVFVVEAAARVGGCVVPRCGGSNVVGATVAPPCCVALSLRRLDRILGLDESRQVVEVEAGAVVGVVEEWLRRRGYTLAFHPQSEDWACVAGAVAMLGSGYATPGYGNIEDVVVWYDVALPSLGLVTLGSRHNPRGRVGPGLWALALGAEGSLGVVLRAGLRVRAAPEERAALAASFPSFGDALGFARRLVQWNPPALLRVQDEVESSLYYGVDGNVVLVEYWGLAGQARRLAEAAEAEARRMGGALLDPGLVDRWRRERRSYGEASRRAAEAGLAFDTLDMAGGWDAIERLHVALREELPRAGALMVFSHASHFYPGGGTLYTTVLMPRDAAAYWRVWEAAVAAARRAGASIVHHHGFGLLRARWAGEEVSGASVYCRVKEALDPSGALVSPGFWGLCKPWRRGSQS